LKVIKKKIIHLYNLFSEVTPNSIAELVGLRPGDAILKINNVETSWMDHNRGKQEIVNAGDEFYLEVQR
jgi:membrane-associated protease RseP (regulator of RpoE activity)